MYNYNLIDYNSPFSGAFTDRDFKSIDRATVSVFHSSSQEEDR